MEASVQPLQTFQRWSGRGFADLKAAIRQRAAELYTSFMQPADFPVEA
jgi:hypothetical protein